MDTVNMYGNLNKYMENPMFILSIIVILVFFLIISVSLGSGTSDNGSFSTSENNNSGNVFVYLFIFILVVLLLVNVLYYVYNIDILKSISSLLILDKNLEHQDKDQDKDQDKTPSQLQDKTQTQTKDQDLVQQNKPSIPTSSSSSESAAPSPVLSGPPNKSKKQVFNIPGNYYTYDNAKALCAAYGADLATYKQVEDAYNKGAEWCNYGWSADQLALFPTQQNTYNELQKKPGRGNDCGRPGVNGGYIDNPNVRFGVNCYGQKPTMTSEEYHLMQTMPPYPQTAEEIEFQKKVDTLKSNLDKILISPFNHNSWNEV
jgi:hypothetical protein